MTSRTKKRLVFLCLTLVVLGGAGVGAVSLRRVQRDRALERSLNEGLAALESKNYPQALDKLGYYVGRRPEDGPAVLALARTRWKIPTENGEYLGSAARYAQAASRAMPADPAPLEMLLSLYQEMGYLTERIETAERLLALNPRHLDALRARAECHILKNSKEGSLAAAQAWAAAAPEDVGSHAAVIQAMRLDARSSDDIAAYVTTIAQKHPDDFRFAVFQAATYLDVLNDRTAAIGSIKRALAMTPSDGPTLASLVLLLDNYAVEKDDPSLEGGADRLLSVVPSDKVFAAEVAAIGAKRDFKLLQPIQSDKWLPPIVAAGESGSDAALGVALFLAGMDDTFKVPNSLKDAFKRRGTSAAEAWHEILSAQEHLRAGDATEARRRLIAAAGFDASNEVILFLIAQADAQIGEWRRAAASLTNLSSADPSWAVARRALVTLLLQANQVHEAHSQASAAYRMRPRLGEAYRLGEASVRVVEVSADPEVIKRVEAFVTALAQERPDDAVVSSLIARMHARGGRTDAALAAARRVLTSKSAMPGENWVSLAEAMRSLDPTLTAALLEHARTTEPQNADVALAAAEHLSITDPSGAEAILTNLAASQSGAAKDATQRRVAAFLDRRADPRAMGMLQQIAADHPRDPAAQTLLLNSASAWKDQSTVETAIKRYREISGEDSTLWRVFEARRLMVFTPAADYASRAVQLLVPVVNAEPYNAPALALLAEANRVLGDSGKTIDYLTRAVDANPGDPTFYPSLIGSLDRVGRRGESDRRLDALLALTNLTPDLRRQRAQILADHERWSEAAADYESIARIGDPDDRLSLALMLARAGKHEQAGPIFDELVKAPRPSANALMAAADFAASQGKIDAGAELLKRLPPEMPEAERLATQASFLERHRRSDEAQRLFEAAAKSGGPDRAADLALFYLRHGKADAAASTAAEALKSAPDHKRLKALSNVAQVKQGGTLAPGALGSTLASLVTDEDPKATEQWLAAIALLETTPPNRERYLAEITALTRAHPKFYPGWHTLIVASMEARDVDGVVRAARGVQTALPDQPRSARLAAEALAMCDKLNEAAEAAGHWQRLSGADTFEADMELARIQLLRQRPGDAAELARKWSERVVTESDRLPGPLETYASVLVQTGEAVKARELMLAKAKESPAWIAPFLRVASLNVKDAAAQRAWAGDAASLRLDAALTLMLGTYWHDLAARTGSADDLAQVIKTLGGLQTDDTSIRRGMHLLLASCYQARNQHAEAQKEYRLALEAAPDDPLTLNNLAYVLLTQGGSVAEAASLAQKAVAQAERLGLPRDFQASALDTLGLTQLRQARSSEAITTYEKAAKLNPADVSIMVGLAEAQVMSDRISDARATLSRVETMLSAAPTRDGDLLKRIATLRERLGTPATRRTSG